MILEKTENQIGKKGFEKVCQARYMLLKEVTPEKIFNSLKSFNEIELKSLKYFYGLFGCDIEPQLEFTLDYVPKIVEDLKRELFLYQKNTNIEARRSIYHRVFRQMYPTDYPKLNIVLLNRMRLHEES